MTSRENFTRMLIRFIVQNLFSFQEATEFNLLPGRFNRLSHHLNEATPISVLKMNAIYGANGAGKSNLVQALMLLKDIVVEGQMPIEFITQTFKLDPDSKKKDVYLGIEFIKDNVPYYYGITINQGIIVEEELQISGLGKQDDQRLFLRTDKVSKKNLSIEFSDSIQEDSEASLFSNFLKNELLERNKPVLFYMKNRQNKVFDPFKKALSWFDRDLQLLFPHSRPGAIVLLLELNKSFRRFATQCLRTFNTGIKDIKIDTIPIEDFYGEDDKAKVERLTAELRAEPNKAKGMGDSQEEVIFLLENDKVVVKRIKLSHEEDHEKAVFFLSEESDGTRRLIEYLPVLYSIVREKRTYIIDEIERSIHPLLLKELIQKFSLDETTKGQLIFTTHESNLLDQEIFRPDEIWFAQKNKQGATEIYPLSEFKEHHTIDIRKGYLNGRYGGIPFLGNLRDLSWEQPAKAH